MGRMRGYPDFNGYCGLHEWLCVNSQFVTAIGHGLHAIGCVSNEKGLDSVKLILFLIFSNGFDV